MSTYKETSIDKLTAKTKQLSAMLVVTYGGEDFATFSEEVRQNYMWACHDLAKDIERLASEIASSGQKA
jgi:hypothetical protein